MARGRKPGMAGTVDQQIEKAQIRVVKTKTAYDSAVEALQKLLDKRDAQRKNEIWEAIIQSNKSYDEILSLISDDGEED